jgi:hypothetical protein
MLVENLLESGKRDDATLLRVYLNETSIDVLPFIGELALYLIKRSLALNL